MGQSISNLRSNISTNVSELATEYQAAKARLAKMAWIAIIMLVLLIIIANTFTYGVVGFMDEYIFVKKIPAWAQYFIVAVIFFIILLILLYYTKTSVATLL